MSETPRVPDPRIERAAEWLYNRDARRTGGLSWKAASELTRDSYRDSAASLLSAIADEPARVEVGAPESADTRQVGADGSYATCGEKDPATGCYCTAIFDHAGPHAASNGKEIVAVWPSDTEEGEGAREYQRAVNDVCGLLRDANTLHAVPGASDGLPERNPLWDAANYIEGKLAPDEAPSVPEQHTTVSATEAQDGDVDRGIAPPAFADADDDALNSTGPACEARSPQQPDGIFYCTRDAGHSGIHAAANAQEVVCRWPAPEAEGERDEARADEWEIEVCPECGATAEDGPSDCDRCELEGVPLETITVVPKTRAVTLTAERDEARSELRLLTQAHVEAVRELSELRARVERQGEALEAADELADQVDEYYRVEREAIENSACAWPA